MVDTLRDGVSDGIYAIAAAPVWCAEAMASPQRETTVLFAMSRADKAALKAEAEALGITMQALFERRLLGRLHATRLPPGRAPRNGAGEEQLPLTG